MRKKNIPKIIGESHIIKSAPLDLQWEQTNNKSSTVPKRVVSEILVKKETNVEKEVTEAITVKEEHIDSIPSEVYPKKHSRMEKPIREIIVKEELIDSIAQQTEEEILTLHSPQKEHVLSSMEIAQGQNVALDKMSNEHSIRMTRSRKRNIDDLHTSGSHPNLTKEAMIQDQLSTKQFKKASKCSLKNGKNKINAAISIHCETQLFCNSAVESKLSSINSSCDVDCSHKGDKELNVGKNTVCEKDFKYAPKSVLIMYKCPICEYECQEMCKLNRHIERNHSKPDSKKHSFNEVTVKEEQNSDSESSRAEISLEKNLPAPKPTNTMTDCGKINPQEIKKEKDAKAQFEEDRIWTLDHKRKLLFCFYYAGYKNWKRLQYRILEDMVKKSDLPEVKRNLPVKIFYSLISQMHKYFSTEEMESIKENALEKAHDDYTNRRDSDEVILMTQPVPKKEWKISRRKWTLDQKKILLYCYYYSKYEHWGRKRSIIMEEQMKQSDLSKEKKNISRRKQHSLISQMYKYLPEEEIENIKERALKKARDDYTERQEEEMKMGKRNNWSREDRWTLMWAMDYAMKKHSHLSRSKKEWMNIFFHLCPEKKDITAVKLTTQKHNFLRKGVFNEKEILYMYQEVKNLIEGEKCPIKNPIPLPPSTL